DGVTAAAPRARPAGAVRPAGRAGPRRRPGQAGGQLPSRAVRRAQRGDAALVRRLPRRRPAVRRLRRPRQGLLLTRGVAVLTGVALALSQLPAELAQAPALRRRVYDRGGERGAQVLAAGPHPPP